MIFEVYVLYTWVFPSLVPRPPPPPPPPPLSILQVTKAVAPEVCYAPQYYCHFQEIAMRSKITNCIPHGLAEWLHFRDITTVMPPIKSPTFYFDCAQCYVDTSFWSFFQIRSHIPADMPTNPIPCNPATFDPILTSVFISGPGKLS